MIIRAQAAQHLWGRDQDRDHRLYLLPFPRQSSEIGKDAQKETAGLKKYCMRWQSYFSCFILALLAGGERDLGTPSKSSPIVENPLYVHNWQKCCIPGLHRNTVSFWGFAISPLPRPLTRGSSSAVFFFFFSDNAHSSELSNVVHGRCAWCAGSKR